MSDDVSPYLRIADDLRARITGGEFQPGDRLPSLAELSREHGYSIAVGQSAYRVLEQDGLVLARQGRGYFVRAQDPPPVLVRRQRVPAGDGSPVQSTLARQGVAGTWRHESQPRAADERIATRLEIRLGDPVMHTSYVYLADGDPVQLAESWEPMAITGGSLVVLPEAGPHAGIGVADRMAIIGIEAGTPVERVSARGATRAEAQALGIAPTAPVLAIERTYYDQATGRPVETADITLNGARWVSEYGHRPSR